MKTTFSILLLIPMVLGCIWTKATGLTDGITYGKQLLANQAIIEENDKNNSLAPDILDLVEAAKEQNALLDSVYIDMYLDYQLEKRKWVLDYDNGQLRSREYQYFSDSYDVRFGLCARWWYNASGQLEKYEELNRVYDMVDSIIPLDFEYYYYDNGLLVKRNSWGRRHIHGSIGIIDGDTVFSVEVSFNEIDYYYQYNERNLLEIMYCKRKDDWNIDSVYYEKIYFYNANDRLEYVTEYSEEQGVSSIRKYEYETTVNSEMIHEKTLLNVDVLHVNKDTIQNWTDARDYLFLYNIGGKDSIYIFTELEDDLNQDFGQVKIAYFYNEDGSISNAIYYFWLGTLNNGFLFEQVKTKYTYDSDGKLTHYQKNYYDAQYNEWRIQETHTYFYSSTVATKVDQAKLKNEFSVFPNPASDHITVQTENSTQAQYYIYDLYGRQMLSGNLQNNTIDVSGLARGTYLLRIINGYSTNIKRFVKK